MTLINPPLLTHGGTHAARAFRMMVRDLARGSQGVTEGDDLKVRQLTTPGAGVRVVDGSAVIRGAAWGQGSYTQYNVGDATVPVAPTGASARSDLVCLRVEDPEYEGTRDPETDEIGYFHVVSNVSATATTVPSGMTAVPLARVDIPANTSVITDSMIKDLRQIANPRRERTLYTAYPGSLSQLTAQNGQWYNWPTAARWKVPVPTWAVTVKLVVTLAGLRLSRADVFANMQTVLGTTYGQAVAIDDDQGANTRRNTVVLADTISVSAALRGTTQDLYVRTQPSKSESGDLGVDAATSLIADVEFTEGVR
ncbi:hypothetical protein [Streptomyces aurantiogriseus]|uniref:Uncharacterized protein n=1 Tax=Streptomyces aurantiogriseus TaxID=66870 RepID=A0A918C574_9ACTN|nr:hypothetical protein [Streptomyces aurantiogriseus]GGR06529.1 hypothetical protein GCM10010251_22870 [Streptomyces aurantiogriseus]